jgi:hypothetical protein
MKITISAQVQHIFRRLQTAGKGNSFKSLAVSQFTEKEPREKPRHGMVRPLQCRRFPGVRCIDSFWGFTIVEQLETQSWGQGRWVHILSLD